jgi:hypothetical protein
MVAYFSSRMNKHLQGAIALGLLLFCLLGTQAIGLKHSISHAQGNQQTVLGVSDTDPLLQHGSASCHLFDALSLASFITPDLTVSLAHVPLHIAFIAHNHSLTNSRSPNPYQSRAPPTFTL